MALPVTACGESIVNDGHVRWVRTSSHRATCARVIYLGSSAMCVRPVHPSHIHDAPLYTARDWRATYDIVRTGMRE